MSEQKVVCCICQDAIDEHVKTLSCNHSFHKDCIDQWIELRNLCPVCRKVADESRPVRSLEDREDNLSRDAIASFLEQFEQFRQLRPRHRSVLDSFLPDAEYIQIDLVPLSQHVHNRPLLPNMPCYDVWCSHCRNVFCVSEIKRCSACHRTRYCSRECQVNDWANHRNECRSHR